MMNVVKIVMETKEVVMDVSMHPIEFVQPIVKDVLLHADKYKWTLQGFGMLRTYFGDARLAVWDNRYTANPVPSIIHDHQWDFKSLIVAGKLTNTTFRKTTIRGCYERMMCRRIKPGEGLRVVSTDEECWLYRHSPITMTAGDYYVQRFDDIHMTEFLDGTVTFILRDRGDRPDEARVFWPVGEKWVTAEPRLATPEEVYDITQNSLARWFK